MKTCLPTDEWDYTAPVVDLNYGTSWEDHLYTNKRTGLTDRAALIGHMIWLSDCRAPKGLKIQARLLDGIGPISWDPSHDQPRLSLVPGESFALLSGNASGKGGSRRGDPVAVAGMGGGRTLALTSNPMRTACFSGTPLDPGMTNFMTRALDWLSGGTSAGSFDVVIAQMGQSYYFPDQVATRDWLDATYGDAVSYNAAEACDGDALVR